MVTEPGLHVKVPWPFQNVLYVDKRVLMLDLPTEEVIAQDSKRLVVDAYARWRITDPLRFYQSLTDEAVAQVRLAADPRLQCAPHPRRADLRRGAVG